MINININIHQLNNEEENNKNFIDDYFKENNLAKEKYNDDENIKYENKS